MPGLYAGLGDVAQGFMQGVQISNAFEREARADETAKFNRDIARSKLYFEGYAAVKTPEDAARINGWFKKFGLPEIDLAEVTKRQGAYHKLMRYTMAGDVSGLADDDIYDAMERAPEDIRKGVFEKAKDDREAQDMFAVGFGAKQLMAQNPGMDYQSAARQSAMGDPARLRTYAKHKGAFGPELSAEKQVEYGALPKLDGRLIAAVRFGFDPGEPHPLEVARLQKPGDTVEILCAVAEAAGVMGRVVQSCVGAGVTIQTGGTR